jgi:hypothetical protein
MIDICCIFNISVQFHRPDVLEPKSGAADTASTVPILEVIFDANFTEHVQTLDQYHFFDSLLALLTVNHHLH